MEGKGNEREGGERRVREVRGPQHQLLVPPAVGCRDAENDRVDAKYISAAHAVYADSCLGCTGCRPVTKQRIIRVNATDGRGWQWRPVKSKLRYFFNQIRLD